MMLFRSARESDLDAIHKLTEHSGIGLTTLPKDKEFLRQRLKWSCDSFQKAVNSPDNEYYFFVLENTDTAQIVGTSAIEAKIGSDLPFYSYKVSKQTHSCPSLNIHTEYETLNLVNDLHGRSEICTLFLEPAFRKDHNGLLLSRARFLFMAHYPARFAPIIIAELRGISDEKGNSPFWDNVGQHFFQMPYAKADKLTLLTNKQFITDLIPKDPIYINLLSPTAQTAIAKPHPSTVPAMTILLHEGFHYNSYVDIFDAGPTIEAPYLKIRTIATSCLYTIGRFRDKISSAPFLLANNQLNFCATISQIAINQEEKTCVISKKTAALLELKCGDCLRAAPLT